MKPTDEQIAAIRAEKENCNVYNGVKLWGEYLKCDPPTIVDGFGIFCDGCGKEIHESHWSKDDGEIIKCYCNECRMADVRRKRIERRTIPPAPRIVTPYWKGRDAEIEHSRYWMLGMTDEEVQIIKNYREGKSEIPPTPHPQLIEWAKKNIWHEKQNRPELVVEEIMKADKLFMENIQKDRIRNFLYSVLLRTGVNKWMMVRKLIIRYKKLIGDEANRKLETAKFSKAMGEATDDKWKRRRYYNDYFYQKGYAAALNRVRQDLKTLCMGPRWVVWNCHEPGIVDCSGMKPGFVGKFMRLYKTLMETKFEGK